MRPDVIVVCVETSEKHVTDLPALVAEVLSLGTADKDYNEKFRLYEEHAGDYYLIVDPDRKHTHFLYAKRTRQICPRRTGESAGRFNLW